MSDQLADKKQNKWDNNKQAQRAREEAIRNQQKFSKQLTECPFCPDSPNVLKHLIIASGVRTYLALPQRGILAPGHCFIVPMAHVNSTLQADEDVWSEMRVLFFELFFFIFDAPPFFPFFFSFGRTLKSA